MIAVIPLLLLSLPMLGEIREIKFGVHIAVICPTILAPCKLKASTNAIIISDTVAQMDEPILSFHVHFQLPEN